MYFFPLYVCILICFEIIRCTIFYAFDAGSCTFSDSISLKLLCDPRIILSLSLSLPVSVGFFDYKLFFILLSFHSCFCNWPPSIAQQAPVFGKWNNFFEQLSDEIEKNVQLIFLGCTAKKKRKYTRQNIKRETEKDRTWKEKISSDIK